MHFPFLQHFLPELLRHQQNLSDYTAAFFLLFWLKVNTVLNASPEKAFTQSSARNFMGKEVERSLDNPIVPGFPCPTAHKPSVFWIKRYSTQLYSGCMSFPCRKSKVPNSNLSSGRMSVIIEEINESEIRIGAIMSQHRLNFLSNPLCCLLRESSLPLRKHKGFCHEFITWIQTNSFTNLHCHINSWRTSPEPKTTSLNAPNTKYSFLKSSWTSHILHVLVSHLTKSRSPWQLKTNHFCS